MSDDFVNRVTLECLVNKELYSSQLRNKTATSSDKKDARFYKKRIYNLFKEMINGTPNLELFSDVKSSYDTFVRTAIQYFKAIDRSDLIQSDHNNVGSLTQDVDNNSIDCSTNYVSNYTESLLTMRSIKIETPTLDKYVTKIKTKKATEVILPQQKDIDIQNPNLKSKGIKKNNITTIYEDTK
jgi:hypothetical protein